MKIKPRKTSRLAILLSVFVLSSVMNMQSKSVNITMQTSSQEVNNIIEKKGKPIIERFQTTRFIVKYKNDDGLTQLKEEIKDKVKSSKEIKDKYFSIVNTEQRMKVSDLMDEIKQKKLDSNIEYIQPDYPLTLSSNDTYFDKQWGVYNDKTVIATDIIGKEQSIKFDINAVDAWKYSQGKDTVIAVLDTGIDINHEDLTANIFVNDKEIPGNGVDDDGNGYIDDVNGWNFIDDNNKVHDQDKANDELHGTHVAGIIGAAGNNGKGITGVAPKAKILPLKVFSNGSAFTSDIIEAIDYASKMGVKIVNCSWGSNKDNPALEDAISNSDMLFVCAAGNGQSDLDVNPVYPASYDLDNVISVASMSQTGMLSAFSNYGELSVDVAAPGENIISTSPNNEYRQYSGTSMSAAFVSGEASLVLSQNQEVDTLEIKDTIINSSDRLSILLHKVNTGNKINAGNALKGIVTSKESLLSIDKSDESSNIEETQRGSDYNLFATIGTWGSIPNMPSPRYGEASVVVNGKIYVIAGDNGYSTNTVLEYNPSTGTWSNKLTLPISRTDFKVATVNNKIYIMGGYCSGAIASVQEYDPATNTVVQKANMPSVRHSFGAEAVNGLIYIIGGVSGSGVTNSVMEYNPQTDVWTTKANIPTARTELSTAVVNGKIYAIGGFDDYWGVLNTVEVYDPSTNTWSSKPGMPTSRGSHASTSVNGKIFVIGGNTYDEEDSMNIMEEYDPVTDTWCSNGRMSAYRSYLGAVSINNVIYAIGGCSAVNSFLSSVETFTTQVTNDDYGNDFSTAGIISPNSSKSGTIETAGDIDFFKFVPTTTGYHYIQTTGSTDTYGYIYDGSQTLLSQNDDSDDLNFGIGTNLTSGQTYYVKVKHYSSTGTGAYTLKVYSDDAGNAIKTAKPSAINTRISGSIGYAGDVDCYSFTPTVTGNYSITSSGSTDTFGYLYDNNGYVAASNDNTNGNGNNFYINAALTANVTYYVKVKHASSIGTGSYGLIVQPDDVGSFIGSAKGISLGTKNQANIDYAGDIDYYSFTPTVTGNYSIVSSGTTDTYGQLYNSAGTLITSNDNSIDSNFYIYTTLSANQTYYVSVKHSSGTGTGSYGINVLQDDASNYFSNAKIITAGAQNSGNIEYASDEDYYSFTPTATGFYSIISSGNTDTYGYLYDSNKNLITSNDNGADSNFYIYATLTANQTYYIRAKHASSTSTGSYGLIIQADDTSNYFNGAKSITLGVEIQGNIEYAGDFDFYTFTPSTSGTYSISTTGSTNTYGYLYDSNKNQLVCNDDYNDTNFWINYELTANQIYYVKVKHNSSSATGSYKILFQLGTIYSTSYSVNKTDFTLYLTTAHVKDLASRTFTLTYNTTELDVVDLCGATPQKDLDAASLSNTNIDLKSFTPGKITFTLKTTIPTGKEWSGLINTVKFKSKVSYQTQVMFTMQ